MTLAAGTRLGPYEVLSPLGAGGMGEVYRARDARLGRTVALKVLPEEFFEDEERRLRFEREARTLASLNHPGIAAIFSFEEIPGSSSSSSRHLLVMELVEGEDLAQKLLSGPLPLEESLSLAKQIAEALEAAHEKGIVHRDLKPANVKVTLDGLVKLLDFGLAKIFEGERGAGSGSGPGVTHSPTLTARATAAGVILGTAAYMSPEQARGKTVDKRTDVWAFGCVLYEMLTGKRAFEGETVSDTIAALLTKEPDWAALPEQTPEKVREILRKCLRRDARARLHDIADARLDLEELAAGGQSGHSPFEERQAAPGSTVGRNASAVSVRGSRKSFYLSWTLAAAAALTAGVLALRGRAPKPPRPMRLTVPLSAGQELRFDGDAILAFSPDGSTLVAPAREKGQGWLVRRPLGESVAVPIPGSEAGDSPFFSPDGRWIGFVAASRLMKVPVEGGKPLALAEVRGAGGATWLPDGTLVFSPLYSDGLFRVSAEGGAPERLSTPDHAGAELGHWWPQLLPGGKKVLFTGFRTPVDRSRIGVLDLASRKIQWVVDGGFYGRYVSSGHILFARGQRLFAVPFDVSASTAAGPAVAVLDDVYVSQTSGTAFFAVSSRGTLAYQTSAVADPPREIVWLDRTGKATPALTERRRFGGLALSPDGQRAALSIQQESQDIWVYSFTHGTLSRLTTSEGTEFGPQWSHDGREIFYVVDRPPFELHRMPAGLPDSGHPIFPETPEVDTIGIAVSPDGRTIAFNRSESQTGGNIYTRPVDGSELPRPFRATRAEEHLASFSPDGRWIAYQSDETGRFEVYVEAFPGPGERFQISADGGTEPLWARSGEIFFRHNDEFRVVAPRRPGHLEFDAPRPLFSYPVLHSTNDDTRTWDVTADGSRILAIGIPEASRPRRIEIVTDWTTELARLSGKGRK